MSCSVFLNLNSNVVKKKKVFCFHFPSIYQPSLVFFLHADYNLICSFLWLCQRTLKHVWSPCVSRLGCTKFQSLHGWLIFPSWPPFVWHWPPSHPLPSTPSNSCQSTAFKPTPTTTTATTFIRTAINAKAWHGPWWGLEVIPGLFFQEVRGWSDKRDLEGGVGGWRGRRVVWTGLIHSHRLSAGRRDRSFVFPSLTSASPITYGGGGWDWVWNALAKMQSQAYKWKEDISPILKLLLREIFKKGNNSVLNKYNSILLTFLIFYIQHYYYCFSVKDLQHML